MTSARAVRSSHSTTRRSCCCTDEDALHAAVVLSAEHVQIRGPLFVHAARSKPFSQPCRETQCHEDTIRSRCVSSKIEKGRLYPEQRKNRPLHPRDSVQKACRCSLRSHSCAFQQQRRQFLGTRPRKYTWSTPYSESSRQWGNSAETKRHMRSNFWALVGRR